LPSTVATTTTSAGTRWGHTPTETLRAPPHPSGIFPPHSREPAHRARGIVYLPAGDSGADNGLLMSTLEILKHRRLRVSPSRQGVDSTAKPQIDNDLDGSPKVS
jgi:hypothetical protein